MIDMDLTNVYIYIYTLVYNVHFSFWWHHDMVARSHSQIIHYIQIHPIISSIFHRILNSAHLPFGENSSSWMLRPWYYHHFPGLFIANLRWLAVWNPSEQKKNHQSGLYSQLNGKIKTVPGGALGSVVFSSNRSLLWNQKKSGGIRVKLKGKANPQSVPGWWYTYPSEKYEFVNVNWDDYSGKIIQGMFQSPPSRGYITILSQYYHHIITILSPLIITITIHYHDQPEIYTYINPNKSQFSYGFPMVFR